MANMISTVQTYDLDGVTTEYPIHFDYLARKFVIVTLIGQDRKVLKLNEDYRFAEKRKLSLTRAWGVADGYDLIEIRRITSATDRLVDFSDGSILRAIDLNISAIQALHIAEEARDLTADTIAINNDGNLDARGKHIVNVADAINDGDALNLRTVKGWNESALNSKEAAKRYSEVSLAHSKESERQKNLSLNAAKSSREAANESASSATDSAESALQSSVSASKAEDCMQRACECASKAALSEQNAKDSEESANKHKEDAGEEADRAKSEADRAEQAADDAVAGGIKPSDLTQTITTDKLKAPSNFAASEALKEQDPRQWGVGTGELNILPEAGNFNQPGGLYKFLPGTENIKEVFPSVGAYGSCAVFPYKGTLSTVMYIHNYDQSTPIVIARYDKVDGNKIFYPLTNYQVAQGIGSSTQNVMSQKAVTDALSSHGVGYAQRWKDVSGSRKSDVSYTNSSERPIFISIGKLGKTGTAGVLRVDNVITGRLTGGQMSMTTSAIVPPGKTYIYVGDFNDWAELS